MWTLPVGFLFVLVSVIFTIVETMKNPALLLDFLSFVLVFIGTMATAILILPSKNLKAVIKGMKPLFKTNTSRLVYQEELYQLSKNRKYVTKTRHPLIMQAQTLWDMTADKKYFEGMMSAKKEELDFDMLNVPKFFITLSGYPPALGMIGTVLALVEIFANINSMNGDFTAIGTPMAVGLIGTLVGILVAKNILAPIGDRLTIIAEENLEINQLIYLYLIEINNEIPAAVVKETFEESK